MSKVKCESHVDAGATRIRCWHDYTDCGLTAKYKITYKDGAVKYVCGIHKGKAEYLNHFSHNIEKIESMTPTNQTPTCTSTLFRSVFIAAESAPNRRAAATTRPIYSTNS